MLYNRLFIWLVPLQEFVLVFQAYNLQYIFWNVFYSLLSLAVQYFA